MIYMSPRNQPQTVTGSGKLGINKTFGDFEQAQHMAEHAATALSLGDEVGGDGIHGNTMPHTTKNQENMDNKSLASAFRLKLHKEEMALLERQKNDLADEVE